MNQGLVFNIQRFSLHDGNGIRTNIFFKGCPLRCEWCSNPESQSARIEVINDARKCIHCLACVKACENQAIFVSKKGAKIDKSLCKNCLSCAKVCPPHALYTEGKWYTVDELIQEALKDKDFFEKSNGGITISGGEPLMQKEFMTEFLKRLKQEGIHVVAETTGCVEHEYFKEIIHYIDTLYFDVKHPDTKIHKEKTGKGNAKILENLQYALSVNKDVTARIPMIPDFNFSNKTAYKYIELFKKIGIKKVHLLPFHQYGSEKYKMLGLSYGYKNFENIAKEELKPIKKIFKENGFEVRIGG